MTPKTVKRSLKLLKEAGLVDWYGTKGGGPKNTNYYWFPTRKPSGDTGTKSDEKEGHSFPKEGQNFQRQGHFRPETGTKGPYEPYQEPYQEPLERAGAEEPRKEPPAKEPVSEKFVQFWRVYPKSSKRTYSEHYARSAFYRVVTNGNDPDAIIAAAQRYATKTQAEWVENPEKWLGKEE